MLAYLFHFFQASLSELHSELQEQYLWWWNGPMSKMMFPACGWPVVLFLSRRHHSSLVWIVPCIYWNILTCCYHMKLLDGKNCFFFCCCYCCSWRRFWSCWLWNGSSTSMRGLSIHSVHFLWVLDLKINCWFTQTHVNGNPLQYSCLKNSMDRGDKTLIALITCV